MKFIKKIKHCWMYEVEAGDDMIAITAAWTNKGICWTGGHPDCAENQFLRGAWPLIKYTVLYNNSLLPGHLVILDTELDTPEPAGNRYLVYNPLSSLPVTQTYATQRQARKVAEAMAKKQSEPFFVCQVLYGVLQDDNTLQEIPSDNCR